MRNVNDEGMEWLQKENELKKNILNKVTGSFIRNDDSQRPTTSNASIGGESRLNSQTASSVDELTRKKFEKFLKGSKK